MESSDRVLFYFADPMCSWCWGFSPVIELIKGCFGESVQIALVLGGLRPMNTSPMTASNRAEILHHWHEVQRMTGQQFRFDSAMPDGFVYDTEPASRAVVTMGDIKPRDILSFFKTVQSAFYVQGKDVTQEEVLVGLTTDFGVDKSEFLNTMRSDSIKSRTLAHFQMARQFGVTGFPTLILREPDGYHLVTHGYRDYASLEASLETLLAA